MKKRKKLLKEVRRKFVFSSYRFIVNIGWGSSYFNFLLIFGNNAIVFRKFSLGLTVLAFWNLSNAFCWPKTDPTRYLNRCKSTPSVVVEVTIQLLSDSACIQDGATDEFGCATDNGWPNTITQR